MGDSSTTVSGKLDDSGMVDLTGKITVVAVLMLSLVVVFVFLLHIYAKWFWNRRREESSNTDPAATTRRRSDLAPGYHELALRRGLDPSVLKAIPVVVFSAKDFKDGLECAVCLCEVSEGEKARLLPKCNHGFHAECIDMWFHSHSSCPICRNLVSNQSNLSPGSALELNSILEATHLQDYMNAESYTTLEAPPNFPTNVLFWGNDVEVRTLGNYLEEGQQGINLSQQPVSGSSSSFPSSSSRSGSSRLDGVLAIDIPPQQVNEDEEPKSPAPTRLRSLKRLLSRDNRRVGPCSPRDLDVEQATRSLRVES